MKYIDNKYRVDERLYTIFCSWAKRKNTYMSLQNYIFWLQDRLEKIIQISTGSEK